MKTESKIRVTKDRLVISVPLNKVMDILGLEDRITGAVENAVEQLVERVQPEVQPEAVPETPAANPEVPPVV